MSKLSGIIELVVDAIRDLFTDGESKELFPDTTSTLHHQIPA